jgi:protein-L-isoaspartate(D-aspartate) O-methyltransferase
MVRQEVIESGITNERVIAAMRETPRHLFVAAQHRRQAYFDMAIPIGEGQTISSPFIVAYMTEQLDPHPNDKVLEIGTGSGYQAAVLSHLVAKVYSIEIVEPLGKRAAQTLRRLEYSTVVTKVGDGFQGWSEHAPFDKIIVTCSPQRVPRPLVEQLREGGLVVVPLGERYQQSLVLLRKIRGRMEIESVRPTFFVPMTGRAEALRRSNSDDGVPRLVNGDFKQTDDNGILLGWYYVRQAEVTTEDEEGGDSNSYLLFSNGTPGRGSQALQPLGMDGRQIREIEVSVRRAMENVSRGLSPQQLPHIELNFFDEQRAPINTAVVGPWHGTSRWSEQRAIIKVPVKARLAVLAVGMFGATGQLSVDRIRVDIRETKPR